MTERQKIRIRELMHENERLKREVFDRECVNDAWALKVDELTNERELLLRKINHGCANFNCSLCDGTEGTGQ